MKYVNEGPTKFVAATVLMIAMAIVTSRQLYLFVAFRSPDGLLNMQGGRYHLWLAMGALLLASLAAGLMFLFFLGERKSSRSVWMSSHEVRPAPLKVNQNAASPAVERFDAIRWAELNDWCVEGQADDRRLTNGSVGKSAGSASARRSAARLAHQAMYRRWAGERHD